MTFPESNALKGTISSLKEIIERSEVDTVESMNVLGQIESIVTDIERKTKASKVQAQVQAFVAPAALAAPLAF